MATTKATTLAHTLGGISSDISTAEINRLDGVTGDLQTQLDAKLATATASSTYAPLASPTFTGDSVFDTSTLKIDATNNRVGIGTASPTQDLDFGGGNRNIRLSTRGHFGSGYSTEATILGHSVKAETGASNASRMLVTESNSAGGAPAAIRMVSGQMEFHTASSGTSGATFDSERMRITSDGKVGIGTTSPSDPFHVIARTPNTNNPLLVHKVESICTGTVTNGFGARIQFNTSMTGQNNVELGSVGFINADVSGAYGQFVVYVRPNATSVLKFKVHNNGDTYTNDGSVSSLSDVRAKKDIVDLTDGLDIVNKLKPRTFKYNGKTEMGVDDGVTRYGFIADEVQSVAPHYVEETNEMLDGEWVTDFKSLSTTRMIPMLVNAVQELSAKVTELENATN